MKADTKPLDFRRQLNGAAFAGTLLLVAFAGGFALWAATASLAGAVIATGQFVVDTNVKKVQHPSGGIVGEIKVREGTRVEEGDLLIRLDETVTRANLQVIVKQLDEFAARRERLLAERDGRPDMAVAEELAARLAEPAIGKLIEAERILFDIRRSARDGQRSQLRKRVAQLGDEIRGLRAQLGAKEAEAVIIAKELVGVRGLYAKNLVQLTRLSALERDATVNEGARGQLVASIAQSEGKIAETELQILQIEQELRSETMKELRDIQGKEAELVEKRVAAEDQLKRIDIRSPAMGFVHQLAAHTVGGVVSPADPVMLIVPMNDALYVEARVTPQDIDQLTLGQRAKVKVQAGNQRTTPEIEGTINRISADVTRDQQSGATYYTVRVAIARSEVERLGSLKLLAGMQAEVFLETGARTPLEYFLKPLADQLARAFKER